MFQRDGGRGSVKTYKHEVVFLGNCELFFVTGVFAGDNS